MTSPLLPQVTFGAPAPAASPAAAQASTSVSAIGYGAMSLSSVYGSADEAESRRTVARVLDLGITLIDTADAYGRGANERLVGEVVRSRGAHNGQVMVATKVGLAGDPESGKAEFRGDPEYLRSAAEASAARLGVETLDLLYLHRIDTRVPIEESVGALADLVERGLVRRIGLCEVSAEDLRRAASVHPIAAVQSEWSLFSRDVEDSVLPAVSEVGATFVAYSPLGRGMAAGLLAGEQMEEGDFRRLLPRFAGEAAHANAVLAEKVAAIAAGHDASAAQVALAWLLRAGERWGVTVVPIPGTRRAERVEENLGALQVQLSAAERDTLDALAAAVQGARGM